RRFGMAGLLGLSLLWRPPAPATEPPRLSLAAASANQQLADTIVSHLRQSGRLRHYTVDVVVHGGQVELAASVAHQAQRAGVPGVERGADRMTVAGASSGVVPARAQAQPLPPGKLPDPVPQPPVGNGRAAVAPTAIPEPTPVFRGPMPGPYGISPPNMPPY